MKKLLIDEIETFYFESNQFWKIIKTQEDLDLMVELVPEYRKAKKNVYRESSDNYPAFGFYREYDGELLLGAWLDNQK
jgi:hypothetical protein